MYLTEEVIDEERERRAKEEIIIIIRIKKREKDEDDTWHLSIKGIKKRHWLVGGIGHSGGGAELELAAPEPDNRSARALMARTCISSAAM